MSFPLFKHPSVTPRCLQQKVQTPCPGSSTMIWFHTLGPARAKVFAVPQMCRALFGPLPALCPLLKMPVHPLFLTSPLQDARPVS